MAINFKIMKFPCFELLKPYANGFLTQITLKNAQNKHTVPVNCQQKVD